MAEFKVRGPLLLSQVTRHTPPPLPLSVHTSGAEPTPQQLRSSAVSQPCNLAVAHCNVTRDAERPSVGTFRVPVHDCTQVLLVLRASRPLRPPGGDPTCLHVPRPSGVARTQ